VKARGQSAGQQRRDEFRRSPFQRDGVVWKLSLNSRNTADDVLASRRACADPQPSFAHLRDVECFTRDGHFLQNFFRVVQQMFAACVSTTFLPSVKSDSQYRLQRLHRVADARLREVQFARGCVKLPVRASAQNARTATVEGALMYESGLISIEIKSSNHAPIFIFARTQLNVRVAIKKAP